MPEKNGLLPPSNLEALNIFLGEIFEKRMAEKFPEIKITPENRLQYYKLWANGVAAGLELSSAIGSLKEGEAL